MWYEKTYLLRSWLRLLGDVQRNNADFNALRGAKPDTVGLL
jgi:hypothetical protein